MGNIAVVIISFRIGFSGYNAFDIGIEIKNNVNELQEISSVLRKNTIIHTYQFKIGDIISIKRNVWG